MWGFCLPAGFCVPTGKHRGTARNATTASSGATHSPGTSSGATCNPDSWPTRVLAARARCRGAATSVDAAADAADAADSADSATPTRHPTKALQEAECVVCLDAAATHLCAPCGHRCGCRGCLATLQRMRAPCPLCRTPIAAIQPAVFQGAGPARWRPKKVWAGHTAPGPPRKDFVVPGLGAAVGRAGRQALLRQHGEAMLARLRRPSPDHEVWPPRSEGGGEGGGGSGQPSAPTPSAERRETVWAHRRDTAPPQAAARHSQHAAPVMDW